MDPSSLINNELLAFRIQTHIVSGNLTLSSVSSLLHFMGYEREMTQALYGPDLFDPSAEPDTFNTRFNARLGQPARWYSIHADALRNPVAEDASLQWPRILATVA